MTRTRVTHVERRRSRLPAAACLLMAVVGGTACSSDPVAYVTADEIGMVSVAPSADPSQYARDQLTVDSARVREDRMHVFVTYGGGCADHDFAAVAHTGWMESEPVQLGLFIAHDAHGDRCRALLRSELTFDLDPVRRAYEAAYRTATGRIILRISPGHEPTRVATTALYEF
jgi:hypothetical protein